MPLCFVALNNKISAATASVVPPQKSAHEEDAFCRGHQAVPWSRRPKQGTTLWRDWGGGERRLSNTFLILIKGSIGTPWFKGASRPEDLRSVAVDSVHGSCFGSRPNALLPQAQRKNENAKEGDVVHRGDLEGHGERCPATRGAVLAV